MANDNQDALNTGALLLGGGVAGYVAGRWIVARRLNDKGAPEAATPPLTVALPLVLPPAASSPAPAPSAPALPPAPASAPTPPAAPVRPRPVQRPKQPRVKAGPASGPITSPSQVDTGPITSPSQVDRPRAEARPDAITAPAVGLSRRFDHLYDRYRGAIPIEYLRALAERESGTNPNARTQAARGLMQIIPVALTDYNTRHGTHYQPEHLFDPAINIAIGCDLLRLIIASYQRNHPQVPNLQADWNNSRFVELLTFGWNAGFSEVGGVGLVARYLERRGITDLTIDLVHHFAQSAGASKYLADPTSVRWCKSVASLYARERTSSRHRDASWSPVKTHAEILDEMRAARNEIEALGRDIYTTYREPFKAQLAAAENRFFRTYGRKPGVGRDARNTDYQVVHSWMRPVPSADDLRYMSYQGQFVYQWGEFEREFDSFWAASHMDSPIDLLWRGTYDQAVEYRQRTADWRQRFEEIYARERASSRHRDASWLAVKTPAVILDEMRAARNEVEALGRDIYATYREPFRAQHAAAEERFLKTYGRKPGVGREAQDTDFDVMHSWMRPVPTAEDLRYMSYQGQFVAQWSEFEREFGNFWATHADAWTDRMWRGVYDQAVEYRQRVADWRKRFEQIGGKPTTPPPRPPTEHLLPPEFSMSWKKIAVVGGIAAGALIIPAAIRASRRD